MRITLADKVVAYLALISGLTISAVAIWYSVAGLVSIFAAAVVPIIVMGVVLEVSKLIATVWLKINWHRAPIFIRTYLLIAIAILMVITSMGIFGFLSKAHSDAGLVSGDVQAKIAIYDEKIKTARENIDANRKALKQMDEAVDQVMARSSSETGANRAVAIRRSQQKERARLQSEIQAEQKAISSLSQERAPIAAEVRKVEAEVGPIKYIANFIYGDNPEANILEKAVTWVIIIIVAVFDPLAVILLLASQYSFQWFRQSRDDTDVKIPDYEPDDGPLSDDQVEQLKESVEDFKKEQPTVTTSTGFIAQEVGTLVPEAVAQVKEKSILEQHPYLNQPFAHFGNLTPMVYKPEASVVQFNDAGEHPRDTFDHEKEIETVEPVEDLKFKILPELQQELDYGSIVFPNDPFTGQQHKVVLANGEERNYIFNGSGWIYSPVNNAEIDEESKKKSTYMIKQQDQQVIKTRE
jgi:hypothetical protein